MGVDGVGVSVVGWVWTVGVRVTRGCVVGCGRCGCLCWCVGCRMGVVGMGRCRLVVGVVGGARRAGAPGVAAGADASERFSPCVPSAPPSLSRHIGLPPSQCPMVA